MAASLDIFFENEFIKDLESFFSILLSDTKIKNMIPPPLIDIKGKPINIDVSKHQVDKFDPSTYIKANIEANEWIDAREWDEKKHGKQEMEHIDLANKGAKMLKVNRYPTDIKDIPKKIAELSKKHKRITLRMKNELIFNINCEKGVRFNIGAVWYGPYGYGEKEIDLDEKDLDHYDSCVNLCLKIAELTNSKFFMWCSDYAEKDHEKKNDLTPLDMESALVAVRNDIYDKFKKDFEEFKKKNPETYVGKLETITQKINNYYIIRPKKKEN